MDQPGRPPTEKETEPAGSLVSQILLDLIYEMKIIAKKRLFVLTRAIARTYFNIYK